MGEDDDGKFRIERVKGTVACMNMMEAAYPKLFAGLLCIIYNTAMHEIKCKFIT